ncbi:Panacea domain-containing protein [Staphylococcus equorum]|uniref:Panacea domain-containing protein n=1 Tax=Staphylococcus equorum TaxID=246432 RepID=UPI003EC0AE8F
MSEDLKQIVNWLLSKQSMSPKKLQKMLYYAQAWTVTLTNEQEDTEKNKLFNENFQAWVHGPVIPEVYHEYKEYGYSNIPQISNSPKLEEDVQNILEQIIEVYGGYNGNELENLTHQEEPWLNARNDFSPLELCQEVITVDDMFEYYIKQAN